MPHMSSVGRSDVTDVTLGRILTPFVPDHLGVPVPPHGTRGRDDVTDTPREHSSHLGLRSGSGSSVGQHPTPHVASSLPAMR